GRLGFNYRLDDISAALGIGQVERLDEILAARAAAAERYGELLADVDVESPLANDADHVRSWFVYVVKLPAGVDRDGVMRRMDERGVATAPSRLLAASSKARSRDGSTSETCSAARGGCSRRRQIRTTTSSSERRAAPARRGPAGARGARRS